MGNSFNKENSKKVPVIQSRALNYATNSESHQSESLSLSSNQIKGIRTARMKIKNKQNMKSLDNKYIAGLADRKRKRVAYFKLSSKNSLSIDGFKGLCQVFRNMKSLNKLNFDFSTTPGFQVTQILRIVSSELKHIRDLDDLSIVAIDGEEMENLCTVLKHFCSLCTLVLCFKGLKSLERLNSRLKHLRSLIALGFTFRDSPQFNAEGIASLPLSLRHLPLLSVLSLDLDDSHRIDDKALQCLSLNLKYLSSFSTLKLRFFMFEYFRRSGIKSLLMNLGSLTSITCLQLYFDECRDLFDDELVKILGCMLIKLALLSSLTLVLYRECDLISYEEAESLSSSISQLVSLSSLALYIAWEQLENQTSANLYRRIADLPLLSNLILCLCQVNPEKHLYKTLEELSLALPNFASVSSLHIGFFFWDEIDSKGMKMLSSQLKQLSALHSLTLSFSPFKDINDKGLKTFYEALSHLTSLTKLTLEFRDSEPIGNCESESLYASLTHLKLLSNIDLIFGSSWDSQEKEDFASRLKYLNPSFRIEYKRTGIRVYSI